MLKYSSNSLKEYFPGIVISSWIAGSSIIFLSNFSLIYLSPLMASGLLGIFIRNFVGISKDTLPGVIFSAKRVLRLAVVLLGLRISISQIINMGFLSLFVVYFSCFSTFYLTCWLGKKLRVNRNLIYLIASGTSICGASAIVAINSVMDSSEEDVAYSIALVTCLGTLAMTSYPILANLLELPSNLFGLWCGTSIHEVAQVIGASFQLGEVSGEIATITKLSRVALIIPLVSFLSFQNSFQSKDKEVNSPINSFPWFVLGFFLLVIINSLHFLSPEIIQTALNLNQFLLCMAMASMGLLTRFSSLKQIGVRPVYLASFSWLYLGFVSLALFKINLGL